MKVGLATDLNDEQCLILLHGMKKMDDEFKSELKSLTDEEMTKSELFRLIKNFSTLSPDERKRLEYLIMSNLNRGSGDYSDSIGDRSGEEKQRAGPSKMEAMKAQNASLDSYLQTLLKTDEDAEAIGKLDDAVDAGSELNLSYRGKNKRLVIRNLTRTFFKLHLNENKSIL